MRCSRWQVMAWLKSRSTKHAWTSLGSNGAGRTRFLTSCRTTHPSEAPFSILHIPKCTTVAVSSRCHTKYMGRANSIHTPTMRSSGSTMYIWVLYPPTPTGKLVESLAFLKAYLRYGDTLRSAVEPGRAARERTPSNANIDCVLVVFSHRTIFHSLF